MKLLVVEDDETTRNYIKKGFEELGDVVDVAETGPDGLFHATSNQYDLIILDRMLPSIDGLKILAAMRAAKISTPVIILSALGHVDERIKGLQAGSDDYLSKPFSFQELQVRASILVSRKQEPNSSYPATQLALGDLLMDLVAHTVTRSGREIKLQPKEFQLLKYLLEHPGKVISRTLLLESVWDYHFDPKTNVIDVHVAKLRKKLEEFGHSQLIHTVRGAGYVVRES